MIDIGIVFFSIGWFIIKNCIFIIGSFDICFFVVFCFVVVSICRKNDNVLRFFMEVYFFFLRVNCINVLSCVLGLLLLLLIFKLFIVFWKLVWDLVIVDFILYIKFLGLLKGFLGLFIYDVRLNWLFGWMFRIEEISLGIKFCNIGRLFL